VQEIGDYFFRGCAGLVGRTEYVGKYYDYGYDAKAKLNNALLTIGALIGLFIT